MSILIGIFGGDRRQIYLSQALAKYGYQIQTYQLMETIFLENCTQARSLQELFEKCCILIGPIPFTKDQQSIHSHSPAPDLSLDHVNKLLCKNHLLMGGNLPARTREYCDQQKIGYFDFMLNEKVAILNAIATAEGTIMEAILASDINLHQSNCLVLGFGRCAKILASKLKGLDAKVTISARSEEALAYAKAYGYEALPIDQMRNQLPSFSFIFNTIPTFILDSDCLLLTQANVTIIDIASAPGGVDYDYAKEIHRNAKLCLGLPGKIASRASADILMEVIKPFIMERSD